jgi:hypothetical protein
MRCRRSQREEPLLGTWEARPLRQSIQLPLLTSCNRVPYCVVEYITSQKLDLTCVENKRGMNEREKNSHRGSESENGEMEQPESLKLVSFVLDDDDEYTPSTPTRGNHSIYPTLALQGKAISPFRQLSWYARPSSVALRISSHTPALSSIL